MQIYKGNSGIMTAKPAPEEREIVPHHLYDLIEFNQEDFNVNKYCELAMEAIADIIKRGKLPIVVGGTNYYIESLVFDKQHSLPEKDPIKFDFNIDEYNKAFDVFVEKNQKYREIIEAFRKEIPMDNKNAIEVKYESEPMHELLEIVDPKMGKYLHCKDKRRIVNALFKYFKYMTKT